ncbi:1,4-dihydroxy-2-naphthoate polyprenyltransferase [Pleomorphovibrio marinus]|uniref:1,4-dihydroxy-2-naphthoate polyprenyltransferase n=1 Tax=Pleomorphovibrio marinus TaxID=2164132 RepID=UPI000E0CB6F2|nr:1,4-dihydroxy-2-naphthoate polyprenyltransferase [Pleomorphovibrio marinus]
MEITLKDKKQAWLHALRLRTLPLALSSIFLASFIAAYHGYFRWEVLLLASLTTLLLQVLSNLANDYGDSVHGADSDNREGPIRAVQSGIIRKEEMKKAMYLVASLAFVSGVSLLLVALYDHPMFLFLFLVLGILSILAAINYTSGHNPYGYIGLGDISVFLFFGLLGVMGTYFLHAVTWNSTLVFPALALGLFSTSVLNINNIRDIYSDQIAGKKSLPVRIGRKNAIVYNWFLILGGNIALLLFVLTNDGYGGLLFLLVFPLMVKNAKGVEREKKAAQLDPYLKKTALSTFLCVLSFGIGLLIF